ncbi:IscS subfamily cysteine desulfurase, partial [Chloroflexota bacterium]
WVKLPTPMIEYKKWRKGGLRRDGSPGFDTPTGKFEIWSTILEDYGYEALPKYIEPLEGPKGSPDMVEDFPLVFNSGARPQTDFRSQHHGIDALVKENPEPTVELNIEDARARGIKDGDLVEVSTLRGAIPFRAVVTKDIIQGAVECNMGGGTPVGPEAWKEWNVNELTDISNYDRISGFPVYKALLCNVAKIEQGMGKKQGKVRKRMKEDKTNLVISHAQKRKYHERIYLDNNATTQIDDEVRKSMVPYLETSYGNPSSIHGLGRNAREAVDNARRQVSKLINAQPRRVVFTGGGSEANNLALKGVAFAYRDRGNHIITTAIEHPAVLRTCQFLEKNGCEITYLDVDKNGWLDPDKLRKAITENTVLVSIMMANNEVGTILPVKELCMVAHESGVLFHTDAIQAVGKINVDVEDLNIDMLSIAGHKYHAPKGTGALYIKKDIKLEPVIHGGKQENGLRAGTENVPAIVGFGKASELAMQALRNSCKAESLRLELYKGIEKLVPGAKLNGHPEKCLPNTLNLFLPNIRGESMVIALDQRGISLSSGSACKSGSIEPSHVLIAMGMTEEEAHCSVRFSLSRFTTEEDIEGTLEAVKQVLEEIETTVRFIPCK